MNIQNLIKQTEQHAEDQRQANELNEMITTFRLMIMLTTINDLFNKDSIDKTLQISTEKVLQNLRVGNTTTKDQNDQLNALMNLAKTQVKTLLVENNKQMRTNS